MRTFCNRLFALLAAALACAPAAGNADECAPPADEAVAVSGVDTNNTVQLADGRKVRPRAIVIPALPRDKRNTAAHRAATAAGVFLHKMLDGKKVTFSHPQKPDRHNRIPAQIHVMGDEPVWLQRRLLAAGHARISGEATPCIDEMRVAEAQARTARLGLWADLAYRIRKASPPGGLFQLENTFQIIEGQVRSVAETRRTVYLNFGPDWRKDFTVAIRKRAIPADGLEGTKIRVRGWVKVRNGPLIEVTSPEQLEILRKP